MFGELLVTTVYRYLPRYIKCWPRCLRSQLSISQILTRLKYFSCLLRFNRATLNLLHLKQGQAIPREPQQSISVVLTLEQILYHNVKYWHFHAKFHLFFDNNTIFWWKNSCLKTKTLFLITA